jgi:hypothetical protein
MVRVLQALLALRAVPLNSTGIFLSLGDHALIVGDGAEKTGTYQLRIGKFNAKTLLCSTAGNRFKVLKFLTKFTTKRRRGEAMRGACFPHCFLPAITAGVLYLHKRRTTGGVSTGLAFEIV